MAFYKTVNDAAHGWVNQFSKYPHDMIEKLMDAEPDSWNEITVPTVGDRVYVWNLPDGYDDSEGEIVDASVKADIYRIRLDDGKYVEAGRDSFEVSDDDRLPAWGWLWAFGDSADDYWLSDMDGITQMSRCGFRIFEHDEWGYFFGIDGGGYDFYQEHWIPLYRARGLQWHETEPEKERETA